MTIDEYVEKAKSELDNFRTKWLLAHENDPENWPLDLDEGAWGQQELDERFG